MVGRRRTVIRRASRPSYYVEESDEVVVPVRNYQLSSSAVVPYAGSSALAVAKQRSVAAQQTALMSLMAQQQQLELYDKARKRAEDAKKELVSQQYVNAYTKQLQNLLIAVPAEATRRAEALKTLEKNYNKQKEDMKAANQLWSRNVQTAASSLSAQMQQISGKDKDVAKSLNEYLQTYRDNAAPDSAASANAILMSDVLKDIVPAQGSADTNGLGLLNSVWIGTEI